MQVFVGSTAPDFHASAVMVNNEIVENFNLQSYVNGKTCVLMFYPLNFTFVCPSEIIAIDRKIAEFQKRDCIVMTISVDSHFSHLAWKNTAISQGGIGKVRFPMISDINKAISKSYNVLNRDGLALRGTFIIDKNFVVRHMLVNDMPLGRNIAENFRILDAIEYHGKYGDVCPAGWQKGQPAMKATSDGVKDYLSHNADQL